MTGPNLGYRAIEQVQVVSQDSINPGTALHNMAFFDADGNVIDLTSLNGLNEAAHVAPVTTANATDLTTAEALANANKVAINALIASLITAGLMSAT